MNIYRRSLVVIMLNSLMFLSPTVQADNMMMARTTQGFPEAMAELQNLIKSKGYVISRVQRVDIGLTKSGYKTDKYRVVFYGKPDEIRRLSRRYPELTAYLPLKISIFAEQRDTIMVTANPQHLSKAGDKELTLAIEQWEKDLVDIFHKLRDSN